MGSLPLGRQVKIVKFNIQQRGEILLLSDASMNAQVTPDGITRKFFTVILTGYSSKLFTFALSDISLDIEEIDWKRENIDWQRAQFLLEEKRSP
jgi:hypothetical protein